MTVAYDLSDELAEARRAEYIGQCLSNIAADATAVRKLVNDPAYRPAFLADISLLEYTADEIRAALVLLGRK